MAPSSGFFKFNERGDDAVKKKNFEYAVQSYSDALKANPDEAETYKKLYAACRERRASGQSKPSALDAVVYLPRKKFLTAMAGGFLTALGALILLPGRSKIEGSDLTEGFPFDWLVFLVLTGALAGMAALSPWPRLILWARQGRAARCADLAGRLLLRNPDHLDLLLAQAEASRDAGRPEAAIGIAEWILSFLPDHVEALRLAGELTNTHRKDVPRAKAYYQRILRVTDDTDGDASRAIKNLDAVHTMAQGVEAAATTGNYRGMLKDTKGAEKLEHEQKTLKTSEEVLQAIAYKKEAIAKAPSDWKLWRDLGDLHRRLKDWEEASAALRKAIELEPVNPTLKMSLGNLTLNRHDDRILALRAAIKADPSGGDAAKAKAELVQVEKARWIFATEEFTWRAKEHPTDSKIRFDFGEALYRTGRTRDAIAEFQFAVKDHKLKNASLLRLGECFRKEGQVDLAVKQYERALEDLPTMTETKKAVLYALGDIHEKQGKPVEAKQAWDQLYEADVNYKDVTKRIEALGQKPGG